ncbi:MAG TPA: fibronectin type III-like domain-contianing protein, partial [Chitinophagaceae bacterium]
NFYKAYWKGEEANSKKEIARYIKPHQQVHVPYDEGIFMGYRWYDNYNKDVQFPFGHGLSYTSFRYSDLQLSKKEVAGGDSLTVSFVLTNTGKRAGTEVVQLYLSAPESRVARPVKELKAFQKVYLKAGEHRKVQFVIHPQDAAFWDVKSHQWRVEPGGFDILIGMSSREIVLKDRFSYR